jgi:non-ribosomal peptide synthetase component E (peptide arylation enzyme)
VNQLTTWLSEQVRAELESAGYWNDETWVTYLLRFADENPSAVHVIDEYGSLTRGEVVRRAQHLATYLQSRGDSRGAVVALILPNCKGIPVLGLWP